MIRIGLQRARVRIGLASLLLGFITPGCGGAGRPVVASSPPSPSQSASPPNPSGSAQSAAGDPRITPEGALQRLLSAERVDPDTFTEAFLDQVPVSKIERILAQMRSQYGSFSSATKVGAEYEVVFERATVPTKVVLDGQGRFAGLLFRAPRASKATAEDLVASMKKLSGDASLLVVTSGHEDVGWNADRPLAVGSAFKLAELAALRVAIEQKKRAWKDVVELKPSWKSLPSGILQTWPEHAPITIHSLAALMISVSDNTAANAVLELVGRSEVERFAPHSVPFLTTRELFVLKAKENAGLLKRYRAADEKDKRALLGELAGLSLPDVASLPTEPNALDVEWFFSTRELCTLMSKVGDLPLMSINPGVARAKDWDRVAFKGGSEPGVLNLTVAVERNKKTSCVSATWNAATALDETTLTLIVDQALAFVRSK